MKEFEFTQDELLALSSVIEDITTLSKEGETGGMYAGSAYITPDECRCCANALKKINEYLFDNPTIYKKAYRILKKNSINK